tara:strand:- start:64100 stop:64312 length:213 start_codon:yes stop_codon:yes gene_type:complete
MATKKVGTSGKYGPRYGKTLKVKVATIERQQKKKHKCPGCGKNQVKRISLGIYQCKKCNHKFAGKAYIPK